MKQTLSSVGYDRGISIPEAGTVHNLMHTETITLEVSQDILAALKMGI